MKSKIVGIILIVIAFCGSIPFVVPSPVEAAESTLAAQINTLANTINWADGNPQIQHVGYVFNRVTTPNYYQTYPGTANWYPLVYARLSELDGTSYDRSALQNFARVNAYNMLPNTLNGDWWMYIRMAYHLYDWFPSSWNRATALTQFRQAVAGSIAEEYPSHNVRGNRYYDEYAETADVYLGLGSLTDALDVWEQDYIGHWNGQYWGYNGLSGVETEAGGFAQIAAKLYMASGQTMPHFDTVVADLGYKFLNNAWQGGLWTQYVVSHYQDNRLRLQNTENAWTALQMYWKLFSPTQKANMVSMLTGVGQGGVTAWQHLMASPLYDPASGKFRVMTSDSPVAGTPMDVWTAIALETLFLQGIVPDTGNLAMPLLEEQYEDNLVHWPATNFGFNYNAHSIKIPVRAGTIKFIFGSLEASYSFPADGIYTVNFSTDWNTVTSVQSVGGLTAGIPYLGSSSPPPPQYGSIVVQCSKDGQPLSSVTVTVQSKSNVSGSDGIARIDGLSPGAYTAHAVWQGQSKDSASTNVVAGEDAAVAFDFSSGPVTTGFLTVNAIDESGTFLQGSANIIVTITGPITKSHLIPWVFFPIPLGTYTMTATYNNTVRSGSVTLTSDSPNQTFTLDFGGSNPTPIPYEYLIFAGAVGTVLAVSGIAWKLRGPKQIVRRKRKK